MTSYDIIKHNIRSRLEKCREVARNEYGLAIRPVYTVGSDEVPNFEGSCTLLCLDIGSFLVTAAHVADHSAEQGIYVGGESELVHVTSGFMATVAPKSERRHDHHDFAFCEVTVDMKKNFGNVKYIDESEICDYPENSHGHAFSAIGYPAIVNTVIDHEQHHITYRMWTYSATSLDDSKRIRRKLQVSGKDHAFIRYNRKSLNDDGKVVESLEPFGISGGGLFDLGNIAKVAHALAPKNCQPMLVGILTEVQRKHTAMAATRAVTIVRAIRNACGG